MIYCRAECRGLMTGLTCQTVLLTGSARRVLQVPPLMHSQIRRASLRSIFRVSAVPMTRQYPVLSYETRDTIFSDSEKVEKRDNVAKDNREDFGGTSRREVVFLRYHRRYLPSSSRSRRRRSSRHVMTPRANFNETPSVSPLFHMHKENWPFRVICA